MDIKVARSVIAAILAEAHRVAPQEACGLLLGAPVIGRAITAANVHPTPQTHFEIDPLALIAAHKAARAAGGPALAGYWHSHPSGPPEPSDTDRAHASGDGRVWAKPAGLYHPAALRSMLAATSTRNTANIRFSGIGFSRCASRTP